MKSSDVESDNFTILSDSGQMIGNVTINDRKRIHVDDIGSFGDPNRKHLLIDFAEAEARRLGLVDE